MMATLSKLTRILVVVSLSLSMQGLLVIQGTFLLRQDFITKHLCVNRNVVGSKCNGKCFLMKQMQHHAQHHTHENQATQAPQIAHAIFVHSLAPVGKLPIKAPEESFQYGGLLPQSEGEPHSSIIDPPPRFS
jgi:hypothetical protein